MVIGQTGSGKTTLINSFINFIIGIELDDPIRYIIASKVNVYYLRRHGKYPPLRIIDTPGFEDIDGEEYAKAIIKLIKYSFETIFDSINAICFVVKSSNTRLTLNEKFILYEIMNLFGNDVYENFITMLTFNDGTDPQIIDVIKSKEFIFYKIIPHLKNPWI